MAETNKQVFLQMIIELDVLIANETPLAFHAEVCGRSYMVGGCSRLPLCILYMVNG